VLRVCLAVAALLGVALANGASIANDHIGPFIVSSTDPNVIELNGKIDQNTPAYFHRALSARPQAKVIVLGSPGGFVDEALSLAAEIRARGLSTAIPKGFGCYSACTYLFFAGKEHVVRGELGVHQVSEEGAAPGAKVYDADVRAALKRYGCPKGVIDAMASTPSSELHVFSPREITKFSLNRASAGSRTALYAAR
jgi:hypothetical protein